MNQIPFKTVMWKTQNIQVKLLAIDSRNQYDQENDYPKSRSQSEFINPLSDNTRKDSSSSGALSTL